MTKQERKLFNTLKSLRDALWNSELGDRITGRLNRAYINADKLIREIEAARPSPAPTDGGAET